MRPPADRRRGAADPNPLPVLVSIPHGGTRAPPELAGRIAASQADILDDSDAFTADIYGLRRGIDVEEVIAADVARSFVDPNRPPDAAGPAHPDGAVKSETCFGAALYRPGAEPGAGLAAGLIARHHGGYHAALRAALSNPRLRLCVDCHSMAAEAPPRSSPDGAGTPRPAFCLSDAGGAACPRPVLDRLAACVAASFGVRRGGVRINDPFTGGYIVRTYGAAGGGAGGAAAAAAAAAPGGGGGASGRRAPWVQIEMSRSLYLDGPQPSGGSSGGPSADPARLAALNAMFLGALRAFFA